MLPDDRRTGDHLAAIEEAVRPGDVVLNIGTGVLAVAAARAGARRVYAVEASDIAEVAGRVFAANGVQDRVTLIPGWSRTVDLPEPVDVLVAATEGRRPPCVDRSTPASHRPRCESSRVGETLRA